MIGSKLERPEAYQSRVKGQFTFSPDHVSTYAERESISATLNADSGLDRLTTLFEPYSNAERCGS